MSVLLETSVGELVIDVFTEACPIAAQNFLQLCTMKYYHGCLLYNLQPNYIVQTGDPTGTGKGGTSIFGLLGKQRFFSDEPSPVKCNRIGLVGMAHLQGPDTNQSQFFITLRAEDMEHLGKEYTIFGEVAEGLEVLEAINGLFADEDGRPYQDIRILHTHILDDPFPPLSAPIPQSPTGARPSQETVPARLPYTSSEVPVDTRSAEEIEESIRVKEARSRAIVLEMVGDLPDAEVAPPAEVLFVCKLNPVTRDEDLEIIFSRFGTIKCCEIIRDHKTGDSLNYAFIEFESEGAAVEAYHKMNNAVIDERRIKVDFSQSVSKLWNRFLLKPRKQPTVKRENPQQMGIYGKGRGSGSAPGPVAVKTEVRDKEREQDSRARSYAVKKEEQPYGGDRHRGRDKDSSGAGREKNKGRSRSRDREREKDNKGAGRDRSRSRDRDSRRDDGHRHGHGHSHSDKDRKRGRDSRDRDGGRAEDRDSHRDRDRDRSRDGDHDRRRR